MKSNQDHLQNLKITDVNVKILATKKRTIGKKSEMKFYTRKKVN